MIYGFLQGTKTELSSCHRRCLAQKAYDIYLLVSVLKKEFGDTCSRLWKTQSPEKLDSGKDVTVPSLKHPKL